MSRFMMAAYGMNTNPQDMAYRCPDAEIIGTATLKDWQLKFRYHADIEPAPYKNLEVLLWSISEADLESLDQLEGYPTYYTRFTVPVERNGEILEALIYMMNDQSYERSPEKRYFDLCHAGYQANSMNTQQLYDAYKSAFFE